MIVVGFGYKARHGKNYVAERVAEQLGQRGIRAEIRGFADALKAHCRVAYGMAEKDPKLLQMVGTDLYRRYRPNIWVDTLKYTLKEANPPVALITDMRFPNEMRMVKDMGGFTVAMHRLNSDGTLYVAPDRDPNHPSETGLDGYVFDMEFHVASGDTPGLHDAAASITLEIMSRIYLKWATVSMHTTEDGVAPV